MDPIHKKALANKTSEIMKRISNPVVLSAHLKTIFSTADLEEIEAKTSQRGATTGAQTLLSLLEKRGPKAFALFTQALLDPAINNADLADDLEQEERKLRGIAGSLVKDIPFALRTKIERMLNINSINDWRGLAAAMKLSIDDVDKVEEGENGKITGLFDKMILTKTTITDLLDFLRHPAVQRLDVIDEIVESYIFDLPKALSENESSELDKTVTSDPRNTKVTEMQLQEISDDVGNCLSEVVPLLSLPPLYISTVQKKYRINKERARAILREWKEKETCNATVGRLADVFEKVGRKDIAEILLRDVWQMDKLSIVPEPSLKSAHVGESVEGPIDDISMDPGELPMATASGVTDIRAATMMLEAKHEECIRVLPYTKDGQIVVQFYVYSGESRIPKDLKDKAQTFFQDMHVKLEWSDLFNDSVNILNVQRLEYPFGKPTPLTASQVDEMNEVIEKNLPELSKHRNITSVQASFKITHFKQTVKPCITIHVLGKGLIPFGESMFPNDLEGYPVDVVNGFWRRAVLIDTQEAKREAQDHNEDGLKFGASIGVQGKVASGTLGAIVKSGSTYYALSCDHVMNSKESRSIVHPGLYDHLKYLKCSLRGYISWLEKLPNVKIDSNETEKKLKDLSSKEELENIFKQMKSKRSEFDSKSTDETENNVALNEIKKTVAVLEKGIEEMLEKPPRVIGEYRGGFSGNFKWTDDKEYFIDAAIAKLSDEEVENIQKNGAQLHCTLLKPGTECYSPEEIYGANKLFKSGRTTGCTEIDNVDNILKATTAPQFIRERSQSTFDGPLLTSSAREYRCENCRRSSIVRFESGAPRHCNDCNQIEERLPGSLWFKRCFCIQHGHSKPFASDGDSGSVIFGQPEGDSNLKGLGLLFGLLEHQNHDYILASPLDVVLNVFTRELLGGSGLKLVGNTNA